MPRICDAGSVSNSVFVPVKKEKPQCKIHNVIVSLCDPSYGCMCVYMHIYMYV